ncbi:hypothetical protein [Streptomyces sp. NPDC088847]|uniref:hypothetical protein n=1 Tax=Streptomyces sp. NPDC088847 TaxID=3365909 RepID=UPI00380D65F5
MSAEINSESVRTAAAEAALVNPPVTESRYTPDKDHMKLLAATFKAAGLAAKLRGGSLREKTIARAFAATGKKLSDASKGIVSQQQSGPLIPRYTPQQTKPTSQIFNSSIQIALAAALPSGVRRDVQSVASSTAPPVAHAMQPSPMAKRSR